MRTLRKSLLVLLSCLLVFALWGCSSNREGELRVPDSSNNLSGSNYNDVVMLFESAGFTNIQTEAIEDLIIGWLTKDGEVEEISINGTTSFGSDTYFPKDAVVIVRYHTFPANTELTEDTENTSEINNHSSAPGDDNGSSVEANPTIISVPELASTMYGSNQANRVYQFEATLSHVDYWGYDFNNNYTVWVSEPPEDPNNVLMITVPESTAKTLSPGTSAVFVVKVFLVKDVTGSSTMPFLQTLSINGDTSARGTDNGNIDK